MLYDELTDAEQAAVTRWKERATEIGENAMIEAFHEETKNDTEAYRLMVASTHVMAVTDTMYKGKTNEGAVQQLLQATIARINEIGRDGLRTPKPQELQGLYLANVGVTMALQETKVIDEAVGLDVDERLLMCAVAAVLVKDDQELLHMSRAMLIGTVGLAC